MPILTDLPCSVKLMYTVYHTFLLTYLYRHVKFRFVLESQVVLDGELLYTMILQVNLFANANKLTSRIIVYIDMY